MATGDLTDVKGQHKEAMESQDPSKNLGQNFEKNYGKCFKAGSNPNKV